MIFGTGSPRFIYNHSLPGEVTVDLDHAKVLDFTPETEYVEQVSLIDGQIERFSCGASWTVRILVHLFKYAIEMMWVQWEDKNGDPMYDRDGHPIKVQVPTPETASNPGVYETYQQIVGYIGKNVTLYLHRDGLPFLGSLTEDCLFTLKEVAPFFLTTTDFKDAAILTFENVEVTNALPVPGRYVQVPWFDSAGDQMYDEAHNPIYVQVLM